MLLDTSGLLAFHHKAEPNHAAAVRLFGEATFRLTHSYILAEFVALAEARGLPRQPSLAFVQEIVSVVETEHGSETLTPKEFSARYNWTNDPNRVRLSGD